MRAVTGSAKASVNPVKGSVNGSVNPRSVKVSAKASVNPVSQGVRQGVRQSGQSRGQPRCQSIRSVKGSVKGSVNPRSSTKKRSGHPRWCGSLCAPTIQTTPTRTSFHPAAQNYKHSSTLASGGRQRQHGARTVNVLLTVGLLVHILVLFWVLSFYLELCVLAHVSSHQGG